MEITRLSLYGILDNKKGGIIKLTEDDESVILNYLYNKYGKINVTEIKGVQQIRLTEV